MDDALDRLHASVDALLAATEAKRVDESARARTMLASIEAERRRLAQVQAQLVAALERRSGGDRLSLVGGLSSWLHISRPDAATRVRLAGDVVARIGLTGEALPPIFDSVATALRSGSIGPEHARVVIRTIEALPATAIPVATTAEQVLVEFAEHHDPVQLARHGQDLLAALDPDGAEPTDERQRRQRGLGLRVLGDGSGELTGRLTAAATAIWRPILEALGVPRPAPDGGRDERRPAQRTHDAFEEAGLRLLRTGDLSDQGGVPVTVLATVSLDRPDIGIGYAVTAHGDRLSRDALHGMSDELDQVTVGLDAVGAVRVAGRHRRLASRTQRLLLAARDRGCSFPGCDRPPSWCQAHHVRAWADGGPTTLTNLTLLCAYHHREFERMGWRCRMSAGRPEWIPPAWFDPAQVPIRNDTDHRTALLAGLARLDAAAEVGHRSERLPVDAA